MTTILVVTKDVVTGEATTSPQMYRNIGEAKRAWGNAIAELSKNNPSNVPIRDLQLWQLGEFNTETLEIKPKTDLVCNAVEFLAEV